MTYHHCKFRPRFSFQHTSFCRAHSSASRWRPLQELADGRLETFRHEAFTPSLPALLPRGHFHGLPAIRKWFIPSEKHIGTSNLNHAHLGAFGTAVVPLELSRLLGVTPIHEIQKSFQRAEAPFHIFLEWTKLATAETSERLYLAQASFASLPEALTEDLPVPDIVAKAGTADIYDTNLWMGIAPTYTPLHRDPNPNLFIQLAGHKIVRILPPNAGDMTFGRIQDTLGTSGSATFRGDEMMKGEEKRLLEAEIWGDSSQSSNDQGEGYEAHVWGSDGLFIPKGWWHSIKGVDNGISASVNWWFR